MGLPRELNLRKSITPLDYGVATEQSEAILNL